MRKYKSLKPDNYTCEVKDVKVTKNGNIDYTLKVVKPEKYKGVTLKNRILNLLRR